jgi:ketosteroid isomerase-like protein
MAEPAIETVRRVYEAVARGDEATVLSLYHPDIEWHTAGTPMGQVAGGMVMRGHDDLRRFFQDFYEVFAGVRYELDEVLEAGSQVISVVTMRGRGRASGADVEELQYGLWTVEDGKVTRVVWFRSREAALAAAATP